jgi:TolB-like protein
MTRVVLGLCLVFCVAACTRPALAQGIDQRILELSQKISNGLTENQKRTIAVVEFADLRGNVTDFGRFIAEELITRLYETKKFKVIERQLLNKVVAEQKLSLTGMIDQTSAQKLGKLLGVDAIASGTITDLGKTLRVNARLIDTSTGEIFAVASAEIAKDDSVMTLMGAGSSVSTTPSGTSSQDANVIATKDIGSLRIVLKSLMPTKVNDAGGQRVNGIRCVFNFTNRETQTPIFAAMHAWPFGTVDTGYAYIAGPGQAPGNVLRTTLVDERGRVWSLYPSNVTGMSIVSAGLGDSGSLFSPTDIPSLLQRQDEIGTNVSAYGRSYAFVFGSTTLIPPGQTMTVIMSFAQHIQDSNSGSPKSIEIVAEIVVGTPTTGMKKSYSLHNLAFDRLNIPGGEP